MTRYFPKIEFRGKLRPSQEEVVRIAEEQFRVGEKRIHVVAPPGSGKTVLGLYLWGHFAKCPAVVLSPNSAIQAQWAARTDLFEISPGGNGTVSTDSKSPGALTSLTYQAVTLPRRADLALQSTALERWQEKLILAGQASDPEEAHIWISDLERHNSDYYQERFAVYLKEVRDEAMLGGDALKMLHRSSLDTLHRLREKKVGLIILDECHHLMGHWGRVLADIEDYLSGPLIVGLTATPPDILGKNEKDIERYRKFFGPIDYQVPVPAVVKDGFLAPYQDLAYFVRPTAEEISFVANADKELRQIVEELCWDKISPQEDLDCEESLPDWIIRVLGQRILPMGVVDDWESFEKRDPAFADAARCFLLNRGLVFPEGVPLDQSALMESETSDISVLVPVLDRYVRHRLRRSKRKSEHLLAEKICDRLRILGVQITETGTRACASPVGRVIAYSRSKARAITAILKAEMDALGEKIRAVVIADYEKTSAVSSEIEHLLDDEAGGAVAAFRELLSHSATDALDPILLTGSSVLVDDDLAPKFLDAAMQWLQNEGYSLNLSFVEEDGFMLLKGEGKDWCPRVYVEMITELFQRGLSKCLVGTRGLLGEGWDASKANVLIDLTTVTTSMSVNQLRGRSIRLDRDEPQKLADNWDVVCIAPEFSKGLDDYERFNKKHKVLFGVTDDGAIEKGVGHVHAAFTELRPEGVEGSVQMLNADMLARVRRREDFRRLWKIGEPYHPEAVHSVELKLGGDEGSGFPPFARSELPWSSSSLTLAVGNALLHALWEIELLKDRCEMQIGERAGGYVRGFLKGAKEQENKLFSEAMAEVFGPLERPRYVVPRFSDFVEDSWLSKILPSILAKYFKHRKRKTVMLHAVPAILAKNKSSALIFQKYWNKFVSPGEVVYAHHGEGEKIVERAKQGEWASAGIVRKKEIFL